MRTGLPFVRLYVLICLSTTTFLHAGAQSIQTPDGKFEAGLALGPSFFVGDLGGNRGEGKTFVKDVNLPLTKLMKGLFLNFYPSEWLGLRLGISKGYVQGFDSVIDVKGTAERFRKQRNLGFRSKLSEAYFALEIYPTVLMERYEGLEHKLRPYGLAGIGMFHFNPEGQYIEPNGNKRWVELRPLHLEGQGFPEYPNRKEYALTQAELVMGAGFKYYIKENMYVGFEILHRKTFTDYLDDVSTEYIDPQLFDVHLAPEQAVIARQLHYREQMLNPAISRNYINEQRGDPKQNDAFFSALIRIGWRFGGANPMDRNTRRQLKCPVFF